MRYGFRHIGRFMAAAVVAVFASSMYIQSANAETIAVISGDNVNVRTEPGLHGTVLRQYSHGESIDIINIEPNGWYRIVDPNGNGFAFVTSEFVSIQQVEGVINENRINIREGASTEHKVLGVLNKGDIVSIVGSEGNFYMFNFEDKMGYVFKPYVDGEFLGFVEEQSATVLTAAAPIKTTSSAPPAMYGLVTSPTGVNLRTGPGTDYPVVFALPYDDAFDVVERGTTWHKVSYAGVQGYINADFISVHTGTKPNRDARTQKVNAVLNFAKLYQGTPYVWGGTNLSRGVDCSGFTYSVFRNFGYSLNRTSRDQIKNGTRISSRSSLMAGDLVFFDTNRSGQISHVGIYLGGGQMIHSSSGSRTMKVVIESIDTAYYTPRFMGGARIIN